MIDTLENELVVHMNKAKSGYITISHIVANYNYRYYEIYKELATNRMFKQSHLTYEGELMYYRASVWNAIKDFWNTARYINYIRFNGK